MIKNTTNFGYKEYKLILKLIYLRTLKRLFIAEILFFIIALFYLLKKDIDSFRVFLICVVAFILTSIIFLLYIIILLLFVYKKNKSIKYYYEFYNDYFIVKYKTNQMFTQKYRNIELIYDLENYLIFIINYKKAYLIDKNTFAPNDYNCLMSNLRNFIPNRIKLKK